MTGPRWREHSPRTRRLLLGCRLGAVVCLIVALLHPSWVSERVAQRRPVVAVVLDDSESMSRPAKGDANGISRYTPGPVRSQGRVAERRALRALPVDDLADRLLPIVRAAGFPVDRAKMLAITPLVRERMKLLRDVLTVADFFFAEDLPPYETSELVPKKGDPALALAVLEQAAQTLAAVDFSHDALDAALRSAAQTLGIKAGQMFEPVRVAVCGRKTAPPLLEPSRFWAAIPACGGLTTPLPS